HRQASIPYPDERDIRSNSDLSIACPGVASLIRATSLIESIERARVLREDFRAALLAQTRRQRKEWVVEVPMRIVASEHVVVPPDPLHPLDEMLRLFGLLHWLGRDPDMLAHVLRRRLAQVRHLVLEPLPVVVHPPADRRQPAEPALDHDDFQIGIALEH